MVHSSFLTIQGRAAVDVEIYRNQADRIEGALVDRLSPHGYAISDLDALDSDLPPGLRSSELRVLHETLKQLRRQTGAGVNTTSMAMALSLQSLEELPPQVLSSASVEGHLAQAYTFLDRDDLGGSLGPIAAAIAALPEDPLTQILSEAVATLRSQIRTSEMNARLGDTPRIQRNQLIFNLLGLMADVRLVVGTGRLSVPDAATVVAPPVVSQPQAAQFAKEAETQLHDFVAAARLDDALAFVNALTQISVDTQYDHRGTLSLLKARFYAAESRTERNSLVGSLLGLGARWRQNVENGTLSFRVDPNSDLGKPKVSDLIGNASNSEPGGKTDGEVAHASSAAPIDIVAFRESFQKMSDADQHTTVSDLVATKKREAATDPQALISLARLEYVLNQLSEQYLDAGQFKLLSPQQYGIQIWRLAVAAAELKPLSSSLPTGKLGTYGFVEALDRLATDLPGALSEFEGLSERRFSTDWILMTSQFNRIRRDYSLGLVSRDDTGAFGAVVTDAAKLLKRQMESAVGADHG